MFRRIIRIRNDLAELQRASREAARFLESQGLAPYFVRTMNLGLEEVVTNIIKYGYDDKRERRIEIKLSLTASELRIVVVDDGREFNPLGHPEPDRTKPLEGREPGGLGIHFLRQLFDDVQYERKSHRNMLVLRKRSPELVRQ